MNGSAETFRPQQSADDARQQLTRWVPVSMPLGEAVKVLQAHGFACQHTQPTNGLRSAMICTFAPSPTSPIARRDTAPPTPVHWFVTLQSKDGTTVSDMLVGRTPRDIGG
ncbi:hypothetical protein [Luteibacter sp. CQ10]|uniref:hypothetical protein n=1 Tax=Luteibacter sp. CQ10 TaxID=2805821 RepID=UPI0034A42394